MPILGATQPVVSRLAKVCYLGASGAVVGKRAACLSARWKVIIIRVGFGPRDGAKWTRLAEIEAT